MDANSLIQAQLQLVWILTVTLAVFPELSGTELKHYTVMLFLCFFFTSKEHPLIGSSLTPLCSHWSDFSSCCHVVATHMILLVNISLFCSCLAPLHFYWPAHHRHEASREWGVYQCFIWKFENSPKYLPMKINCLFLFFPFFAPFLFFPFFAPPLFPLFLHLPFLLLHLHKKASFFIHNDE